MYAGISVLAVVSERLIQTVSLKPPARDRLSAWANDVLPPGDRRSEHGVSFHDRPDVLDRYITQRVSNRVRKDPLHTFLDAQ